MNDTDLNQALKHDAEVSRPQRLSAGGMLGGQVRAVIDITPRWWSKQVVQAQAVAVITAMQAHPTCVVHASQMRLEVEIRVAREHGFQALQKIGDQLAQAVTAAGAMVSTQVDPETPMPQTLASHEEMGPAAGGEPGAVYVRPAPGPGQVR